MVRTTAKWIFSISHYGGKGPQFVHFMRQDYIFMQYVHYLFINTDEKEEEEKRKRFSRSLNDAVASVARCGVYPSEPQHIGLLKSCYPANDIQSSTFIG